jgi:hypothetical protein
MPLADFSDVFVVAVIGFGAWVAFHIVKLTLDARDYRKSRKAFLEQQRLLRSLYHVDEDVPPPPNKVRRKK